MQKSRDLLNQIIRVIAIMLSLYQLYVGYFGAPFSLIHRPLHVLVIFVILFLSGNTKRGPEGELLAADPEDDVKILSIFDIIIVIILMICLGYLIINAHNISNYRIPYFSPVSTIDFITGLMVIIIIIEGARRTIGMTLSVVTVVFIIYALIGNMLPSPFWHRGFSLARIVEQVFLTEDGIWGIPVHVTSTYVYLFVLFGTFLIKSKTGDFFTDIALALTGRYAGGPAKSAIIASSLMGTLSGSSVANVVTTGAFTIPLMKKTGYKPHIAAAIEAVASTGGQFVPPVMGAAAFLMAEFTGTPYIRIMYYALLPAFLYYFSVFIYTHLESVKNGLVGLPKEQLPLLGKTLLKRGYLLIPVILIIIFLMQGWSPLKASFYAVVSLAGLVLVLGKNSLAGFVRIVADSLEGAARTIVPVTVATSCAGIIVGIVLMTGLGSRMTDIILAISGDRINIALILTMVLALILGMGMPSSSAYIIMAALLAPALVAMGIGLIAAHMFVFYFACLSAITPPVAIASYAAAAISQANPMQTGWAAVRMAMPSFIVPFMFVYSPSLLLIGPWSTILTTIPTAMLGVYAFAISMNGYWNKSILNWYLRTIMSVVAILLIIPGIKTDLLGITLFGGVFFLQNIHKQSKKKR